MILVPGAIALLIFLVTTAFTLYSSRRFQFTLRDLLEISVWVAAGMTGTSAARFFVYITLSSGLLRSVRPVLTFTLFLALLMASGAAFGAAAGVIFRKRVRMALAVCLACAILFHFL